MIEHAPKRARARAMRAWIDRTNDGLSGLPADGMACRQKGGTSARPARAGLRLGYINRETDKRRHDRLWPIASFRGGAITRSLSL
jgi:hypothetical protein